MALSQQSAFRLFFGGSKNLPQPSFVSARQPDHGYSPKGDGSDHQPVWLGQSPLDAYYLSSLLPGAPALGKGILHNFLAVQSKDGAIDHRPGLTGQRSKMLAAPLLASLAWELYQSSDDDQFLLDVYPQLLQFFWAWFAPEHDRNNDNLPEWDHPMQTGFEDHPLFSFWHPWSRGLDVSTVHSPSLLASLYHEAQCLIKMAKTVGRDADVAVLKVQTDVLHAGTQSCWEARHAGYRYIDRDTQLAQRGKILLRENGEGTFKLKKDFEKPVRLFIEITPKNDLSRRPEVMISEYITKSGDDENLSQLDFHWRDGSAVATSQKVFTRIGKITVSGIDENAKVIVRTVDLTSEDHTQLTPLWAEVMDTQQAQALIGRTLLNAERFDRPFGIPACPSAPRKEAEAVCLSVHLPWNQLVIEGLLAYGFRAEATRLLVHLMTGISQNLKQNHAFYQYYNAEVGTGIGERNALSGLAPVGLFLKVLGVRIISDTRVQLEGKNPFSWAVTVKYRGLTIKREMQKTKITFPNGEQVEVTDETPCTVSI